MVTMLKIKLRFLIIYSRRKKRFSLKNVSISLNRTNILIKEFCINVNTQEEMQNNSDAPDHIFEFESNHGFTDVIE